MKLLSLRICDHDANFTYFDGSKLTYYKTERFHQIKHHAPSLDLKDWEQELKPLGIKSKDLDEIVIIFDEWKYFKEVDYHEIPGIENYSRFPADTKVTKLNHHYAHALSYWPITDEPDISIIMDGYGEADQAWSIIKKDKLIISGSEEQFGSIGRAMEYTAANLGIICEHPEDLPGKLMGLQSYGKVDKNFRKILSEFNIHRIKEMWDPIQWEKYKGDVLLANHTRLDHVATLHDYSGDMLIEFFKRFCKKEDKIFYSGGVALNVIWNTKLKKEFPNLVIAPHSADEGLSLGGWEYLRRKYNLPKIELENFPYSQFDEAPLEEPSDETIEKVAQHLADGKIVGWYQGHGEIGPRALGNRSILFNPTIENAHNIVNNLKRRETYRPFGASVLLEHKDDYFWNVGFDNPYMVYVYNVKNSRGHKFNLESITHVDGTCRVQTVDNENPTYRKLLEKFYEKTGIAVLLNTSLNLAGKPIMGHIKDTDEIDVDIMVVGNNLKIKKGIN